MHSTIPTTLVAAFVFAGPPSASSSAQSAEGRHSHKLTMDQTERSNHSYALFGKKERALNELIELQTNYDPDLSISLEAFHQAFDLVLALPFDYPMPEFGLEEDGNVAVEWLASRNHAVVLSLSGTNRIAFAWLDGPSHGSGVYLMNQGVLPGDLLKKIREIFR